VETIPHLVMANAERMGTSPAFLRRVGGSWETTTWAEYGRSVRSAARALLAAGIEPGDRVAILSYNTPEWVVFDVAAMAIGAVPVGIYFSSSSHEIADVLDRSGARVLLAETASHIGKVDPSLHPSLDMIIGVDAAPAGTVSWDLFLESGRAEYDDLFERRLASLNPSDPATMIFTAAGHGDAVGVVLTHDNLFFTSRSSVDLFEITENDSALSYLPLSHIAEQIFTILAPAQVGYRVAFAQSIGRMRVDLPDIQPTIFFGVPLVWSGFEKAVRKQVGRIEGVRARAAAWSMDVSRRHRAALNVGKRPGPILSSGMALARRLFTDQAKAAMGFSNARSVFTGAAAIDPSVIEYLAGLDIPIRQVYGLSEATGPSSVTRRGADRYGTVGLPMPGVAIALAGDGEILIRGRSVFAHYLDDDAATEQALQDGWLHTGDLGSLGSDGQMTITGRKKAIVITTGGKNVCSGALERLLRDAPEIVDAVVVGDGHDQLGALVAVDEEVLADPERALDRVRSIVDEVNQRFARAEQIRRVALLPRPLSVEAGERLVSGEVVRSVALDHFAAEVEDLYR